MDRLDSQGTRDEHVDAFLDAYALGALEPDEVALVEQHLPTCDACTALLEQIRAVTDGLLAAVPQVAPPPALRASILSRVRAESDGQQAVQSTQPSQSTPSPETTAAPESGREGRMGRLLRSLFGGEAPTPSNSAADALLRDLLLDPQVVIRPIAATAAAGHAAASFVSASTRHEGVVLAHGLRPLDAAHAYQVWLLRGDQPLPSNLFTVDHAGRGIGIVRASQSPLDFDVLAITPEPAGGSPGPTGAIVLAGALKGE